MSYLFQNAILQGKLSPTSKATCAVATLTNAPLATYIPGQIVDGYTLALTDRILIKNQSTASQNGIYIIEASGPIRATDLLAGALANQINIFIANGSQTNTGWLCTSNPALVGTSDLTYTQFDATSTLQPSRGGTGVTTFGGTNTLLYTTTTNTLANIASVVSAVLVSSAGGTPLYSTILPLAITLTSPFLTTPKVYGQNLINYYTIQPGNITTNHNLNLQSITSDQTFVFDTLSQTLNNKAFIDTITTINNATDQTKVLKFDVSTLPTATTLTLQAPIASGIIATQQYVNGLVNGFDWKQSVRALTTLALSVTPSGSQTTKLLTSTATGNISTFAASFDNVALNLADRVLVNNTAFGGANVSCGIYVVQTVGSPSTPYVLARATDANISADVSTGMAMMIQEGTQWASSQWLLITFMPIVLDTTPLSFTQIAGFTGTAAGGALTGTYPNPQINSSATIGQPLLSSGTVGIAAAFNPLTLSNAAATTGVLPIGNGGTGTPTALTSQIPVALSATTAAWTASNIKTSVLAASTTTLATSGSITGTPVYSPTGGPATSGSIAATLTVSGTFVVDSVTLSTGSRLLLKNESSAGGMGAAANGIWLVTIAGTALTMVRTTDFDQSAKVAVNSVFFTQQGQVNANEPFILTTQPPITIGGISGSLLTFASYRQSTKSSPYDITFWGINGDQPTNYYAYDRGGDIMSNADFPTLINAVVTQWFPTYTQGCSIAFTGGSYYFPSVVTIRNINNFSFNFGAALLIPAAGLAVGASMIQIFTSSYIEYNGGIWTTNFITQPSTKSIYPGLPGNIAYGKYVAYMFNACQFITISNQIHYTLQGIQFNNCSDVAIDNIITSLNESFLNIKSNWDGTHLPLTSNFSVTNFFADFQLDDTIALTNVNAQPSGMSPTFNNISIINCTTIAHPNFSIPADQKTFRSGGGYKINDNTTGSTGICNNLKIIGCTVSGLICGKGIRTYSITNNLVISGCTLNNIANSFPLGAANLNLLLTVPPAMGAIYFDPSSVNNSAVITNNQFNTVSMGIVLGGTTGTLVAGNSQLNTVAQLYSSNWNFPFISATAAGGSTTDATLLQNGNLLDTNPALVQSSTAAFGQHNTLYNDAVLNTSTVNAPPDFVENGIFSVNTIVPGQPVADQAVTSTTQTNTAAIAWQGFMPKNTGNWTQTLVYVTWNNPTGPWNLQLSAYNGNGIGGTLIQQQTFAIGSSASVVPVTLTWTTPISVVAETQYTFSIVNLGDGSSLGVKFNSCIYTTFPYGRGFSSLTPASHVQALEFTITVIPSTTGRRAMQSTNITEANTNIPTLTTVLRNECEEQYAATVTTTTNAVTPIYNVNFAPRVGETMQLTVSVSGRQTAGSGGTVNNGIVVTFANGGIQNKAGVITLTAPTKTIIIRNDATWDVAITLSGTNIIVNVNGNTNETIVWNLSLTLSTPSNVLLY